MNLPKFLTDINITYAHVPLVVDRATARGVLWQAAPGRFQLHIPGVARYLVETGNSVTIDPADGVEHATVSSLFRMAPLAALLYQRGVLALHASAVCSNKGAVLLAGDSGAGKSALLTRLLQRGFSMLSDELSAVGLSDAGKPMVYPTFPEIALWPATLDLLGIPDAMLPFIDNNRKCFTIPGRLAAVAMPLKAVFWLGITKDDRAALADITGAARFQSMGTLSYNSNIADALFDRVDFLRLATAVSSAASLRKLQRPRKGCSVDELADVIALEL